MRPRPDIPGRHQDLELAVNMVHRWLHVWHLKWKCFGDASMWHEKNVCRQRLKNQKPLSKMKRLFPRQTTLQSENERPLHSGHFRSPDSTNGCMAEAAASLATQASHGGAR